MMRTRPVEIALSVVGSLALVYLFLLGYVSAYGSEAWYGTDEVARVGSEWFAWATIGIALLCLISVGLVWRGLPEPEPVTVPRRVGLAVAAGLFAIGTAMVFPTAIGAGREYEDRIILGYPGRWLGWVAIPLALNATVIVVFVLWPRIRNRPHHSRVCRTSCSE